MPHKVTLEDFYKNKQLREHAQRSRAAARALDAGADVLPNVQVMQGGDAPATSPKTEVAPVAPPPPKTGAASRRRAPRV